jgi:hypothetical protein
LELWASDALETELLAPHPVSAATIKVKAASPSSRRVIAFGRLRRRLEKKAPITETSKGRIVAAVRGKRFAAGVLIAGAMNAACVVGVVIVIVTVAEPPGVRVGVELKEQEAPAGRLEQESAIAPEKTPIELRVSWYVDWPVLRAVGRGCEAVRVKVPVGATMVCVIVAALVV